MMTAEGYDKHHLYSGEGADINLPTSARGSKVMVELSITTKNSDNWPVPPRF